MFDDQDRGVQAFGVGVRLGVFQEVEQVLGGFFRPAGFAHAERFTYRFPWVSANRQKRSIQEDCWFEGGKFTLGSPSRGPGVSSHGHGFLLLDHVVQVGQGAGEFPAVDGLGGLPRVLEAHPEVGAAGAGGFGGFDRGSCVADL